MSLSADDKEAIREILAEYVHHMDGRRFAEVAALFTPDGQWRSKLGTATGQRGIEELLRRTTLARDTPAGPRSRRHFVANTTITGQDSNSHARSGRAVSSFFVLQQTDHGLAAVSLGTYTDILVKEDAVWRFQLRDIAHDT